METTAIIRGVHISAQKTRIVADLIRGKSVAQAELLKKDGCFNKPEIVIRLRS